MSIKDRIRPAAVSIHRRLATAGIDGRKAIAAARGLPVIRSERHEYERQRLASNNPNDFPIGRLYPIYSDRFDTAGSASGHYFHQDLLVAREVFERNPIRHVDVGSSIYGFVSHVAAFREIEVFDIRPVPTPVQGIRFIQQDVMNLDSAFHDYADSVSCLHALEHFGLGRYSDPIEYDGWRKGLQSLTRMLKRQGTLYLGVPTGEPQRVEFNAHRVFSLPYLRDVLSEDFAVERLAFVQESGDLVPNVDPYGEEANMSLGAQYGCSIWVLTKR